MDKIWRNDGDDVATFLWFYHPKHFMVFNLSGEEYDYVKFDNRVLDFGFPDHSACPLALLFQVVEAMKKWLSEDEENVAVVHCLAGRGRTGMVISTYLLREGFFRDAKAALKFFAEARSATAAGVLTPSQIRFTHYANEIYRSRIDPPFGKERPLALRKIVISPFPVIPDADDAQRMGGWEPVIKVFTLKGHHKEKNNERLLYSSDYHPTKLYYSKPGNIRVVREVDNGTVNQEKERIRSKLKQKEKIVVDITKGCFVRGDIQLKFFHQASSRISFARILKSGYLKTVEVLSTALSKKYPYVCLFRLSFHTSFVGRQLNEIIAKQRESNDGAGTTGSMGESYDGGNGTVSWTLRKEELDAMFSGPAHTKMLPDDFSIKLVFSDPDADDIPRLSASSSSSSSSPSNSTSSTASMRESNGSRSMPKLPALPPLPSVDKTTSAVASLALSPRGPEQREKLAQRRTGDGRTNARSVNFGGGKYKEAEHQPPPSRAQRGTISYSSIKRHATGPLQNEKRAQQRTIDFEDIFLKTPTTSTGSSASRDRSDQRISESTEPTFPPTSSMRRRSSLPSDTAHQAAAAAATSAAQRRTVTPSPSRAVASREPARPDPAFPSLPTPPSSGGHGQPPQTTRTAPHPAPPPPQPERSAARPADILTTTPALTGSLHSPLRPTPPSSSANMSTPPSSYPSSSSPSPATGHSVISPPASMTPPTSGPPLSSGHFPASTLAAAHNRQSLLQSYPPMHPTLTPTPTMSASPAVAPVSAPIPSPAHTTVLMPMPSHPAVVGGGQPPLTHPRSAPAQFVPGAGSGSGSTQLHAPLTPTPVRHDGHHPAMPSNNPVPYASSGALPARASMSVGHGHVPLQPSPAMSSNGNIGHPPGSAGNFHPQQPHTQQFPQQFLTLHPPLQPEPVAHDFSSRLPPVCFPQASSAQCVDEARERIRQQIISERQRTLYPHQQPHAQQQFQQQPYAQQQQPERARDFHNSVSNNHSANYSNGVGNGSRPSSSSPADRGRDREDRDRRRDETERESMDRREMERRRQDDERMRREWERERAAAGRGAQDQGRGRGRGNGRGEDDSRGGRGGGPAGAPRGGRGDARGGRGSGSSNGGPGPQRTYRISDMQ